MLRAHVTGAYDFRHGDSRNPEDRLRLRLVTTQLYRMANEKMCLANMFYTAVMLLQNSITCPSESVETPAENLRRAKERYARYLYPELPTEQKDTTDERLRKVWEHYFGSKSKKVGS